MPTYTIRFDVQLAEPFLDTLPQQVGHAVATATSTRLVATTRNDTDCRLTVALFAQVDQRPTALLHAIAGELESQLATLDGATITAWDLAEIASPEEVQRRIAAASTPPMIDAKAFAELCKVATQRIYELDGLRRKAVDRGERHPFPTPVVPGWWAQSIAEQYAAGRRTTAGRPPKTA